MTRTLPLLFTFFSLALAQPYSAAEGFGRPVLLANSTSVPGLSVAADGDHLYAYWRDREGAYRLVLDDDAATPERIIASRGIRSLQAVSNANQSALALVIQDIQTGHTDHLVHWQNQEKRAFEALAPAPVALALNGEPVLVYSRTTRGVDTLYLWRWSTGQEALYSSELSIEKTAVWAAANKVVISWLEGSSERGVGGLNTSDWTVKYLTITPGGVGEPVALGAATNLGLASATQMFTHEGNPVLVWTTEAGALAYQVLDTALAGILEPGAPVGIADAHIYWSSRDSIRRVRLGAALTEAENILWTPNFPEQARVRAHDGATFLTWYGGASGNFDLYGSSTLTPIVLTWQDRLAARMGWRPYRVWNTVISQSLFSLLAGLMAMVVFLPLLWLLSLSIGKFIKLGWSKRVGVLVGCSAVSLFIGTVSLGTWGLVVSPLEWLVALVIAAGLGWLAIRHRDVEPTGGLLLGSSLTIFISMSILNFLHFKDWLDPWLSGF